MIWSLSTKRTGWEGAGPRVRLLSPAPPPPRVTGSRAGGRVGGARAYVRTAKRSQPALVPFQEPAIFARETLSRSPHWTQRRSPASRAGVSRRMSAAHAGKSGGQEVRGPGAGVRGKPDAPPAAHPIPCQLCPDALSPPRPRAGGDQGRQGSVLGPGGGGQRGLRAGAGGCGRRGRSGGRKKPRDILCGVPGCRRAPEGTAGPPPGLCLASEPGRSAPASAARRAQRVAEGRAARQEPETQAH